MPIGCAGFAQASGPWDDRILLDRLVLRNAAWASGERVIRGLVSAIVGAWVARYLGPTSYAAIAYALAITTLLGPLSQLGLNSIVVHRLAERPDKSAQIIGTVLALRFLFGCLTLFLCIMVAALTGVRGIDLVIVGIVSLQLVFSLGDVFDYFYQARMMNKVGAQSRVAASLICSVIKVLLIVFSMPVWAFAVVFAFEFLVILLILARQYRRDAQSQGLAFCPALARELLRAGLPFLLSAFAIAFYGRFDQFLIKNLLGAHELGIYAVAAPFFQAFTIVPLALTNSFMPVISRASGVDLTEYHANLSTMFRVVLAVSVIVAVVAAAASPLIVQILLGPAYARSGTVLAIYALAVIPVALGHSWNVWVTISNRGRLLMLNTACGALTSLVANLLLVPRLGIEGAAIAAVLSLLVAGFVVNVFTCPDIARMQIGFRPRPAS